MFALRSVFVASLVFVSACNSCNKPATEGDASVAITDAASTQVAAVDAGPKSNCPTQVSGASVVINDVDSGVEIAITSTNEVATSEIRERAQKLITGEKSDPAGAHQGRCTVILRNTKISSVDVPTGVKMTVLALDKNDVKGLQKETRDRDSESALNQQGAGTLRMQHCPSAVDGAKTSVANSAQGVVVSITGPADKIDEIRARARHTADVSKKETANSGHHTGDGSGGGGVGKCPIVVEDTSVAVRDVANGVEVDVNAVKDVPALQKEAKDRVQAFAQR